MNLCKDCKQYRPQVTVMGGEFIHGGVPECAVGVDPVHGGRQTCSNERTRSGACGPAGERFEKREEGDKRWEMTLWVSQDRTGVIAVKDAPATEEA